MKLTNKLVIPVLSLTLLTGAVFGTIVGTQAFAQSTASSDGFPPVIQKLMDKFNLNTNDVQSTLDEVKSERQAEMETRYEERLTQAVSDGDLTEEKKQLILNKHKELVGQMEQQKTDLQKWADDNGIDLKYLGGFGGGHGGRGFGKGMHAGMEWQ